MDKERNHIILKIEDSGIYFSPSGLIKWEDTNFPPKTNFGISNATPIFWQVEMLAFKKSNGALNLSVLQYEAKPDSNFEQQHPKFALKKLLFQKMDWGQLKNQLSFYSKQDFEQLPKGFLLQEKADVGPVEVPSHSGGIQLDFQQSISKLTFKMGFVETFKKVKEVSGKLRIRIYNPNILPEFEFIKPYFSKALGSRKINIKGYIGNPNDGDTYRFKSKEISSINEELVNGIKRLEIKKKIKAPKVIAVDKSLFTPEEYFDGFEAQKGNQIRKSDKEILGEILGFEGIRNRQQLLFIAGKLQSQTDKILFTLTPKFGFLFTVEGEEMYHFIWELLNSNATYIWSAEKDIPKVDSLKIISFKINFIRDHGRMNYLRSEENDDLIFSKLNHASAGSKLVDGFPRWRAKLSAQLI